MGCQKATHSYYNLLILLDAFVAHSFLIELESEIRSVSVKDGSKLLGYIGINTGAVIHVVAHRSGRYANLGGDILELGIAG